MQSKLQKIWDREYKEKKIMLGSEPVKSLKKFAKLVKKELGLRGKDLPFENFNILELGCGEAKNLAFFAERGANCFGLDVSQVAIENAKRKYGELINLQTFDIENRLPFEDNFFGIALDIMTFHLIKDKDSYLQEVKRVLKPSAFFFLKTFILDNDKNAKALIKRFGETDRSYILPELGLVEHVFYKNELLDIFKRHGFCLKEANDSFHYTKINGKNYKRHYFEAVFVAN